MTNKQKIHDYEFALKNISCTSCVSKIESALAKTPEIIEARVNFADRILQVTTSLDALNIIQQLKQLGYIAEQIKEDVAHDTLTEKPHLWRKVIIPGVLGLFLMFYGLSSLAPTVVPHSINIFWLIMALITLLIMFTAAAHLYKSAYKAFLQHHATMDTLISLGTLAAWIYSIIVIVAPQVIPENARHNYLEAALIIIALVNLGTWLEQKARGKTSEAIKQLIGLQPKFAYRINADGQEEKVAIDQLQIGDLIRVKPGTKIALDGEVIEGSSYVDESMLTGEPVAVVKSATDKVFSGTINKTGSFSYRVTKLTKDTILAQIIALVKQAQNTKPSIARFADMVSGYFVPFVMLCAIAAAIIWFNLGFGIGFVLVAGITVLVIACPCALGLATPISIIVGMGKAAQLGVLIKNGEALQNASKITHVVLDKTGTITKGQPEVMSVTCIKGINEQDLLKIAASLEAHSEHPLAEAIVKKAQHLGDLLQVNNFQSHTGLGVTGEVNGQSIIVGNHKIMANYGLQSLEMETSAAAKSREGQTVMYVAINDVLSGIIAVADPIKEHAKEAIEAFKRNNIQITMITGDNKETAHAIARILDIDNVLAESMPQDKLQHIKALQQKNEIVAMVGDGINDAPALAQSDVGFAIGNGTDIAIESADITLMRSSLTGVVDAILVSRATMKNIKQNLFGAFIYNTLGIPVAAGILFPVFGVLLSPMIAAAAMAASSLTVITNANRLRFFKVKG
ncbi:heavy metal translocating P-type ATPase [Cysteiniphilum halobium]|uniref:heavy metal translocating P-type ATPase n=1 Tax=Cysteiniphilum halobium TaxID=2219059 RepID=UPI000E652412|nr:heavy metal translocating P-type ATPase [Cysteiniphilum halobium]